jgi:hypothetical protein
MTKEQRNTIERLTEDLEQMAVNLERSQNAHRKARIALANELDKQAVAGTEGEVRQ